MGVIYRDNGRDNGNYSKPRPLKPKTLNHIERLFLAAAESSNLLRVLAPERLGS